jgi:hypothetical protein
MGVNPSGGRVKGVGEGYVERDEHALLVEEPVGATAVLGGPDDVAAVVDPERRGGCRPGG